MPKFLDRPTWYDSNGEEAYAEEYKSIVIDSNNFEIQFKDLAPGKYVLVGNSNNASYTTSINVYDKGNLKFTNSYNKETGKFPVYLTKTVFPGLMGVQTIYLILENVGYDDTSLGLFLPSSLGSVGPGEITYVSITYSAIDSSATINSVKSYGGYTINGFPLNAGKQIWAPIATGMTGYILTSGGTGAPKWSPPSSKYIIGNKLTTIPINNVTYASTTGRTWGLYLKILGTVPVTVTVNSASGATLLDSVRYFDGIVYHTADSRNLIVIGYSSTSTAAPTFYAPGTSSVTLSSADTSLRVRTDSSAGYVHVFYAEY